VSPVAVIAAQRAEHGVPVAVSCQALGVSQAWFHKWRKGDRSPRRKRRTALAATIATCSLDTTGPTGRRGSLRTCARWGGG
jgi:hypothetical protein